MRANSKRQPKAKVTSKKPPKKKTKGYTMPKCGDDFSRPIPPGNRKDSDDEDSEISDKNHWKIVFDAHRDEDQKQCELWKDEVNNLIIFAGLFSAVVTAFLIESYKYLLPQGSPDPDKFGIEHGHVIRLNSLWFCSLVLSLAMVVIGIVALQWLRNHQRYHGITPREALSVYQMRRKALKAWHIRWAFLSLPILILVALVLFFVGLVDFLLTLNKAVAAPVGVLVYATLAILFVTTVLPSCQVFWLYISNWRVESNKDMPIPCPYKSPQSLLLLRFFSWILCRVLNQKVRMPRKESDLANVNVSPRLRPLYLLFYNALDHWSHYDTRWLRLRDMYSQTMDIDSQTKPSYSSRSLLHPRRPIFDEAQILRWTLGKLNPSASVLFGAYHCFREVSKSALHEGIESLADYYAPQHDERSKILRGYYWRHLQSFTLVSPPLSRLVANPREDLLQDENMWVFLQMHTSHNLPSQASRVISAHLCELQARMLSFAYASEPPLQLVELPTPTIGPDLTFRWLFVMLQQYIDMIDSTTGPPKLKVWSQFATSSLNGNHVSVSHGTIQTAITQFSTIFERFVHQIDSSEPLRWDGKAIYTHKDVAQFWKVPATMLRYRGTNQKPFSAFSLFEPSLARIRDALASAIPDSEHATSAETRIDQTRIDETKMHETKVDESKIDKAKIDKTKANADYLFLSTCVLVKELFNPYAKLHLYPFEAEQSDLVISLVRTLELYEQSADSLDRIQQNYSAFWVKTGLPDKPHEYEAAINDQVNKVKVFRRSYIYWDYIRSWTEANVTRAIPAFRGQAARS